MAVITNPKIGYRPFPGYSLLFDNPGDENYLIHAGKLDHINCKPGSIPFYDAVNRSMARIGEPELDRHGFLPLNPASYHVTVWDGVNAANVEQVLPEARVEARNFLLGMPFAIRSGKQMMRDVADTPLAAWQGEMRYSYDRLAVIADYVLVVLLKPASERATSTQRSIDHLRSELYTQYEAHYGIGSSTPHMPHLSLGYFLRYEDGARAAGVVDSWDEQLRLALDENADPGIVFNSVSLYGFTDMENFYRPCNQQEKMGSD